MTRLEQLYSLRDRVAEEIATEEAKTARIRRTSSRLPTLAIDNPPLIVKLVADEYGTTPTVLCGGGRSAKLADARAVIAWLADRNGIKRRDTADMLAMANTSSLTIWLKRMQERPDLLARAERLAAQLDGAAAA